MRGACRRSLADRQICLNGDRRAFGIAADGASFAREDPRLPLKKGEKTMLNVYDILVNLIDSERVYEFFEWSTKDDIEHIKKIPLVKVSSHFLDNAIKHTIVIENELLNDIYQKTEVYHKDKVSVIDYVCLILDSYYI